MSGDEQLGIFRHSCQHPKECLVGGVDIELASGINILGVSRRISQEKRSLVIAFM